MSSVISEKIQSYVFSSNPALGALNISPDGSIFSVNLPTPIFIPHGVIDCSLDVIGATIWNVSPNIAAAFGNNLFYFTYLGTPYVITITDGLYSLPQLNGFISRYFVNNGLPRTLIVFTGDQATQTTIMTLNNVGTQVDFTQANTIRTVLGFNSELLPAAPSVIASESFTSEHPAALNRINFYYISSTLVNNGLPLNGISGNIIAQVFITSPAGDQIVYDPQNVIPIEARNLIGKSIQQITFQLLDDQLRTVNTLGEFWSVTLQIKMQLLLSTAELPLLP
jgi:hypothetical protein